MFTKPCTVTKYCGFMHWKISRVRYYMLILFTMERQWLLYTSKKPKTLCTPLSCPTPVCWRDSVSLYLNPTSIEPSDLEFRAKQLQLPHSIHLTDAPLMTLHCSWSIWNHVIFHPFLHLTIQNVLTFVEEFSKYNSIPDNDQPQCTSQNHDP